MRDERTQAWIDLQLWTDEITQRLSDCESSKVIDFFDQRLARKDMVTRGSSLKPTSGESEIGHSILKRLFDVPDINQTDAHKFCQKLRDSLSARVQERYADRVQALLTGLAPGEIVAEKYCVLTKLGQGGTSSVYSAISNDQRLVALKVLPKRTSGNEYRNSILASHRNVRRVLADVEHEGCRVLVLEYVPFMLSECLSTGVYHHRLELEHKYTIARHLCAGISRLHAIGQPHGDIKPENVGVWRLDGTVVAKLIDVTATEATETYHDPHEDICEFPTKSADIFSLAKTLQQLFSGQDSVVDPQLLSTLDDIVKQSPKVRPTLSDLQFAIPDVDDGKSISTTDMYSYSIRPPKRWHAVALAFLVSASLLVSWLTSHKVRFAEQAELSFSEQDMNQSSKELIANLFPTAKPHDNQSGYCYIKPYATTNVATDDAICFYYRQSPRNLLPLTTSISRNFCAPQVTYSDPPFSTPGAVGCVLDSRQNLRELRSFPDPDWTTKTNHRELRQILIESAGLPPVGWHSVNASSSNPMAFPNTKTETWESDAGVRVQMSTVRGIPTWFAVGDASSWSVDQKFVEGSLYDPTANMVTNGLMILAFLYAAWLTYSQRGLIDRLCRMVGIRIAVTTAICLMLGWIGTAAEQLTGPLRHFEHGIANAAFWSVVALVFAVAVEPTWRSVSPRLVKSWFNFWSFEWDQTNVGFDILIGTAAAATLAAIAPISNYFFRESVLEIAPRLGYGLPPPESLYLMSSKLSLASFYLESFSNSLMYTIWLGVFVVMLHNTCTAANRIAKQSGLPITKRKHRIHSTSFSNGTLLSTLTLIGVFFSAYFSNDVFWIPYMFVFAATFAVICVKKGLLASFSMNLSFIIIVYTPMTTSMSSWYGDVQFVGIGAVVFITALGLAICVRPVWFTDIRRLIIGILRRN